MIPRLMRSRNVVLASVCVSLALATSKGAGQVRPMVFDAPWMGYDTSVYPEGINPWDSRVADFNGDGVPDLATVSWQGTAFLSVLSGDGAGGYVPPVTYPMTYESLGVEAADFDGDGDFDLMTSDTGRFWEGFTVSLWRNTGGSFARVGSYSVGQTGPSGITSADFDGDGDIDVATANDRYIEYGNTASVMFNTGTGPQVISQVLNLSEGTRSIANGDLDGDGDVDLIIGHETNKWTILWNDGTGHFASSTVIPGGQSSWIAEFPCLHVSDFDLDDDLDVFFSNMSTGDGTSGGLAFFRNDGTGTFAAAEMVPFNWYTGGAIAVSTADVTGDGWPDAISASGLSGTWFLIEGDGAGGFGSVRRFRAGDEPKAVHGPDLDLDGDLDLVIVAMQSNEACVYRNPGDGSFVQPVPLDMTSPTLAPAFPTNLQSGDIDGDGDLDLVAGFRADFAGRHGVTVRRNNGDGTFAAIEEYRDGTYPTMLRLGDLDLDSDLDLLYLNSQSKVIKRLNDGDGRFASAVTAGTISSGTHFTLHDLDMDGDLDILGNGFMQITAMLNNGDSTFGAAKKSNTGDYFEPIAAGDFNNDGKPDAMHASGGQSSTAISFGLGNGLFGAPFDVPVGRDVHAIAPAFLDHDLNLDLCAEYNLDEKGLSVRRGRGDGNFFLGENHHGSYGWEDHTSGLIMADVDGDWSIDGVTANFSPQDLSVWAGEDSGGFEWLQRYGVAENAFDVNLGDFDGDGVRDAAVMTQVDTGSWWYPGVVILRGIGNANPRSELVLRQDVLRRGAQTTFIVDDLSPGDRVTVVYSTRGSGTVFCPPGTGGLCLDLFGPVSLVASATANANGEARIVKSIPRAAPIGVTVRTQAYVKRGPGGARSVKSNMNVAQITN